MSSRSSDLRFPHALKDDRKEQAVRDLDDATTGLMDGVFAVMTTVYSEPRWTVLDQVSGQPLAGHASITTTMRYMHQYRGEMGRKRTGIEPAVPPLARSTTGFEGRARHQSRTRFRG